MPPFWVHGRHPSSPDTAPSAAHRVQAREVRLLQADAQSHTAQLSPAHGGAPRAPQSLDHGGRARSEGSSRGVRPPGRGDVRSCTRPWSLWTILCPLGLQPSRLQRALSEHPAWEWEEGDFSTLPFLPFPPLLQKLGRAEPVSPKKGHTPWLGGRCLRRAAVGAAAGWAPCVGPEPLSRIAESGLKGPHVESRLLSKMKRRVCV